MPASRGEDVRERIARAIADGDPIDWDRVEREGSLGRAESGALRALEAMRRHHAGEGPPTPPGGPGAADLPLETGYEILEELGHGSFGRVFRAIDRALRCEVALKVFHETEEIPAEARKRFLAEARILASLDHPNIVRVRSVDEVDGRIRIVLDCVRGRTLDRVMKESGPFSAEEAARVGLDLCRALAAIHGKGLVHRDLKPENVMRASGGRIVLLDFGIARSASSREEDDGDLRGGTPLSMAPEQFDGSEVTPRTDIFGLGVLLYWMACGHFPFRRNAGEPDTFEGVRERVLAGRATPLSDRRPDVPRAYAGIVERAIARRPEDRHESAGALEAALQAFLAPAAERRSPPPPPLPGWRRPWAFGPVAVAAVLLVLFRTPLLSLLGPAEFDFQATLYARRGGQDVRLLHGDVVHPGDELAIEVKGSRALHAYVFNVDESQATFVLFPSPDFEIRNPLSADALHRLPGRYRGERHNFVVDQEATKPGAEAFVILASPDPIADAEALVSSLPPARPEEGPRHARLDPAKSAGFARGATRGISKSRPAAEPIGALDVPLPEAFKSLPRLAEGPTRVGGVWGVRISLVRLPLGGGVTEKAPK